MTVTRRALETCYACAAFALIQDASTAYAQTINSDRPGVGSNPQTVPQFTLQAEVGTNTREGRLGILNGFEVDRDDSSWGAKLALVNRTKLQMAIKLSYDNDLKTVIEIPASFTFTSWFSLGTDVIWSHHFQSYAAEFNFNPIKRFTVTPTVYYDTKLRGAIFMAWVPPGHDNIQFDLSYDQQKVSAGISGAFDLKKLFKNK